MNTTWAYCLWLKSLKKENDFFINNLNNPNKIQEQKLFDYLNRFKNSNYGVKHSLSKIATVQEFQKEVPIVDYEDLSTYISCISRGRYGILTCLNMEQAKARKKKGAEAANAIISVLSQK